MHVLYINLIITYTKSTIIHTLLGISSKTTSLSEIKIENINNTS